MTKLVYIQGPAVSKRPPKDEFKDRSKEVPQASFIDYTAMTEGEMKIALLKEQVDILKGFYPEVKDYQEASNVLDMALKDGLHNISYLPGNAANFIRGEVALAIRQTKPAAGYIQRRNDLLKGLGELIPRRECGPNPLQPEDWYSQYGWPPTGQDVKAYKECLNENYYRNILNRNLEGSSHHLLYTYETGPNSRPAIVAAKKLLHDLAIEKLHSITKLDMNNLRLWIRNGVMRSNAKNGAEPLQPEVTIQAMSELIPEKQAKDSISGFPFLLIIGILKAIVAAIGATIAMLEAMKQDDRRQIESTVQSIGLPSFGPQETDWYIQQGSGSVPGSTSAGNSVDILPLLLIGGGALLLSKSN